MAFVKRNIDVTFELGEGDFGESGINKVKLSGLRISSKILKAGGPSMGTADLQIYGMKLDLMNKLSTLGMRPTTIRKNTITIEAGDEGGAMAAVFIGTITDAFTNFQGAPDVAFQVTAHVGAFEAVKTIPPSSFRGSVDVATILSGLATKMGKSFENNGVDVKLSNCYFTGSARDQALKVVKAAGIEWNGLDDQKLAIWPSGQSRGGLVPLIAPRSGLVGYPNFTSKGIMFKTLFNPSIGFGGKIKMESSLTPANGDWIVYALEYDLDAQFPRGQWFSIVSAARPGYVVVA